MSILYAADFIRSIVLYIPLDIRNFATGYTLYIHALWRCLHMGKKHVRTLMQKCRKKDFNGREIMMTIPWNVWPGIVCIFECGFKTLINQRFYRHWSVFEVPVTDILYKQKISAVSIPRSGHWRSVACLQSVKVKFVWMDVIMLWRKLKNQIKRNCWRKYSHVQRLCAPCLCSTASCRLRHSACSQFAWTQSRHW